MPSFWSGEDGDHCLVNWSVFITRVSLEGSRCLVQSALGGRSISVGHGLQGTTSKRQWNISNLPCDKVDMELFCISTKVVEGVLD